MSTGRRRREQERRIKKARRALARGDRARPAGDVTPLQESIQLLSYDITGEPLEQEETANRGVNELLGEERRAELFRRLHEEPQAAIAELEGLLAQCPDSPMLYNWLGSAYGRAGDFANADRIIRLNYERNPDYLFAKVGYAQLCIEQGDLARVAEIFDGKFDLKLLFPGRNVFHLTEFLAFSGVMVPYFSRKGEHRAAELLYDMMKKLAPDHEITRSVGREMEGSILVKLARSLAQRAVRRGRVHGV